MARIKCPKCDFINEEGRPACSRCGNVLPLVKIQAVAPPPAERRHPQMDQIQFRRGQTVAGRYSVLNMIGRGGMGCIYHVRDNALHEEVALKTLLPQFVRDKMVVERFFNEARIARALSHPNIVRVHDIGVTGDIIYISMELIRGKSLRSMLEYSVTDDNIPYKQALGIMVELCDALEYAHRHTVHRDIKPENVMVSDDGTVKLMDFGISKLMDSSRLTGTSIIMGTPMYMSPEQLRNSANVDARADIYSIGVMLYEILTGNLPTSLSKPASQITRGIPPAIDVIVAKCVEPDPAKRFQSAAELREALQPFVADDSAAGGRRTRAGTTGYLTDEPGEAVPWGRRILGGGLVAVIMALTALGFYTLEISRRAQIQKARAARALPVTEQSPEHVFGRLAELREGLRTRLSEMASRNTLYGPMLGSADAAWDRAAAIAARDAAAALEPARLALQAYTGPLAVPPGMVFVPPGDAVVKGSKVAVEGFFIDATEVTVGEYRTFCKEAAWRPPPYDLGVVPGEMPILGVTFYDAQAFAAWAGKSLPTEPQWARAAHGDTDLFYPWESGVWQDSSANTIDSDDGHELAAPVRSFETDRSWVGCYDMVGNVAEWTRSVWAQLPYDAGDGREDLAAVTFDTQLTIRGGSYYDEGKGLQARAPWFFENPAEWLGFRCVVEMPHSLEQTRAMAEKALARE